MQKVSILAVVAFIAMQGYAGAQSTLQKCLGIVPGREPAGILKPSVATMSYCRELPGWNLYEQAGQRFQAGDHRGAAQILEQSAQAGNPIAQLRLAMLYEAGERVPRDLRSAFSWDRAAAQHGEPGAQFELGTYYEYGNGVVADNWDEAAKWYRASAEQGWVKGEAGLGPRTRTASGSRWISSKQSHGTTRLPPRATRRPRTSPNTCATITESTEALAMSRSKRCWDR